MKKVFQTICAIAALSIAAQSCTTAKNAGNGYTKHLEHRHTGAHHLSNGNGGCNWHNN